MTRENHHQEQLFQLPDTPVEAGATAELPDFSGVKPYVVAGHQEALRSDRADSLEKTGLSRAQAEGLAGQSAVKNTLNPTVPKKTKKPKPARRPSVGPDPDYRLPDDQWNLR